MNKSVDYIINELRKITSSDSNKYEFEYYYDSVYKNHLIFINNPMFLEDALLIEILYDISKFFSENFVGESIGFYENKKVIPLDGFECVYQTSIIKYKSVDKIDFKFTCDGNASFNEFTFSSTVFLNTFAYVTALAA